MVSQKNNSKSVKRSVYGTGARKMVDTKSQTPGSSQSRESPVSTLPVGGLNLIAQPGLEQLAGGDTADAEPQTLGISEESDDFADCDDEAASDVFNGEVLSKSLNKQTSGLSASLSTVLSASLPRNCSSPQPGTLLVGSGAHRSSPDAVSPQNKSWSVQPSVVKDLRKQEGVDAFSAARVLGRRRGGVCAVEQTTEFRMEFARKIQLWERGHDGHGPFGEDMSHKQRKGGKGVMNWGTRNGSSPVSGINSNDLSTKPKAASPVARLAQGIKNKVDAARHGFYTGFVEYIPVQNYQMGGNVHR